MKNVIFRGPVSANFVFKNSNSSNLETEHNTNIKSVVSSNHNKVTKAVKVIEADLVKKMNAHKDDNVKGNIKQYNLQSHAVEGKLKDLSFMDKAYKAGIEKLKKLESVENQTEEEKQNVITLSKELKELHQELVSGYNGCMSNVFSNESVTDEVVETPDILSSLFEKR